jgi:branched-chain amino acid transport system substrate-binding protein
MRSLSRLLFILLLPALLPACSDLGIGSGLSGMFETQPPITVAVVGPTRGPYSSIGGEMRAGVQQAEADINAQGGVLGHLLKLRGADDPCDTKRAAGLAAGLVAEKVSFVVGHFCSVSSIAAAPVYGAANILMISPASSSAELTDNAAESGNTDVFRVVPRDDMQGAFLAGHILEHYPGAAIALVGDGTPYGRNVIASTRAALLEKGVQPAATETLPTDGDFASVVARLKGHRVKVIVYGGYAQAGAKFLVEARKEGLAAAFGGGDALMSSEFAKTAGADANGTFMTSLPDPRSVPEAQHAIAGLASFGLEAKGYALYAYAAVQVFAEAAARAKSLDSTAVAKALREGEYDTVLGPLSFDAKGDLKNPRYALYVWQDGTAQKL